MISQRLLRPQLGLRAGASTRTLLSQTHGRELHSVPKLTYYNIFKENGVPGMLSPSGFHMAWDQYQGYLVDKLNEMTAGKPDADVATGSLLTKYARDASNASLFNYASMAHNNHLFFNYLSPEPVEIPTKLLEAIDESCSSLESLKAEFLATANAMFGPGFVWLVKRKDTAELRILCTYIAGSPYPAAHCRLQPIDMATETTGVVSGEPYQAVSKIANRTYGSMGRYSKAKPLAPGGADVHPILCVNTWEHVWLQDWGVGRKAQYLEAWWNSINWEAVAQTYQSIGPDNVMTRRKLPGAYARAYA
ncbi:hypothetical protein LOZ39_002026 [Ophidiomyces ophidiicola]|nr:hypothetical protein LOZ61_004000 [Ophidiomyces ophidiicola]KAI1918840.1 hypothetical protein LOZ64_002601 [Ophidiomyces ophidiicola]KAI1923856.1 hypothetical protein LOZ60_004999 [Ophidiomyces ophidiicola]KAI1963785.1 hypothetical protein LOZ59_001710 [Ophidiomyces ophidiicola]KAI2015044.1 hypothetical protein LOZ49_000964 [Ophidiomyces ophidiicola]